MPNRSILAPSTLLVVCATLLFSIPSTQTVAATLPELPELNDGQYPVGFTTIERFDHSRTIRPAYDYFGEPMEGEAARPIQISIWYPANLTESHQPLLFGEYTFPYPRDNRFFDFLSLLQDRAIGRLQAVLRRDQDLVLDLLSTSGTATIDAPHAEGSFPLVVYCGGRGAGVIDNLALCQYLASHGFVVAAIHSVGATGITPTISAPDLEALARDIEFVVATVRELPEVDLSRLAIMGRGFGGLAGLVAASRYSSIKATITLGTLLATEEHKALLDGHPTFSADGLKIPVMQVFTNDAGTFDRELSIELRRTERTVVSDSNLTRFAVSYWGVLSTLKADSTVGRNPLLGQHEEICRYVCDFLKWRLLDDEESAVMFPTSPEETRRGATGISVASYSAEPGPPTSEQFIQIITDRGVAMAQEICEKFDLPRPDQPLLPEYRFNEMGYGYLQRGGASDAVIVLRWGTMAYPASANAWDSYADACLQSGNREEALRSLRKSLEVLPDDNTLDERTRNYIRENTPTRILELEGGG